MKCLELCTNHTATTFAFVDKEGSPIKRHILEASEWLVTQHKEAKEGSISAALYFASTRRETRLTCS